MRGRLFPVGADWYEWRQDPPLPGTVLIQVALRPDGRLTLSGLRLDGTPTAELLRSIPVGRIEAAANAQLTAVDDHIAPGAPPGPRDGAAPHRPPAMSEGWETVDPSHAASRAVGIGGGRGRADSRAAGTGGGRGRPDSRAAGTGGGRGRPDSRAAGTGGGRGRPDSFYADVAQAYRDLAQESARPAADLADVRGVPITTVYRWIKEARRRSFLPPGRPGKAG